MVLSEKVVDRYLARAMDEFQTSPLAVQLMRRLAGESRELFVNAGLKYMQAGQQDNSHRMLGHLLLRQDSLIERITNPEVNSKAGAVDLFRRFHALDSAFDVRLARRLPCRGAWGQSGTLDAIRSARALDILDETSQGRRLLPILGHLPDSDDPRISARATLFVGKRVQSAEWTARQLGRADPRIRANAVESLWGVKTPAAMQLFDTCVDDLHNRVAGNALVGLHIGGREDALDQIIDMSHESDTERRITSVWAMGRLASEEFGDRLAEMVRDEAPQVRGMAIRALMLLRKSAPVQPVEPLPETLEEAVAPAQMPSPQEDLVMAIDVRLDGRNFRASR